MGIRIKRKSMLSIFCFGDKLPCSSILITVGLMSDVKFFGMLKIKGLPLSMYNIIKYR